LARAPDGALHPAAPKAVPSKHLHPAPTAPAVPPPADSAPPRFKPGDLRARKAAGNGKDSKKDPLVDLGVKVPKKLRKAVRKKSEKEGWTTGDAVAHVLQAWIDS
jgi:hypothetical protein